jgi:CRP/FNR family transcriptional regulator, nitrogen oxide reductase regulator
MASPEVIGVIEGLKPGFLRGLELPELQEVVRQAEYRRFPADATILSQGFPANKVALLTEGLARVTFTTKGGQRLLLRWLPVGEVAGLNAFLPTVSEYAISTEAVKESWVLQWDRSTIRALAAQYPTIWENAFTLISEAFSTYLAVHVSRTCHSAAQRLARVLVDLAGSIGHRGPAGIEVGVNNEDLANAANVTHFTASRLLNEWQRSGLVQKSRGKIVLRSLESLLLHEL